MKTPAAWMTKARDDGPQVFEWRSLHRDGHPFWVEISIRRQTIGSADRLIVTAATSPNANRPRKTAGGSNSASRKPSASKPRPARRRHRPRLQ
jgi:hypothetical protein